MTIRQRSCASEDDYWEMIHSNACHPCYPTLAVLHGSTTDSWTCLRPPTGQDITDDDSAALQARLHRPHPCLPPTCHASMNVHRPAEYVGAERVPPPKGRPRPGCPASATLDNHTCPLPATVYSVPRTQRSTLTPYDYCEHGSPATDLLFPASANKTFNPS
jgi:hypothetical protein